MARGPFSGIPSADECAFKRLVPSINPAWIEQALAATGTATVRTRRLPPEQVIWLVLGMALYRHRPIDDIVLKLNGGSGGRPSRGPGSAGARPNRCNEWSALRSTSIAFRASVHTPALSVEPLRQLCPERCAGLSLSLDLSGAFVLYTADFPPGGDVYNFVWRMGGGLGYEVTSIWRLELGGRWMHVSNGQGLDPFNPSYEGAGATVTSRFRF